MVSYSSPTGTSLALTSLRSAIPREFFQSIGIDSGTGKTTAKRTNLSVKSQIKNPRLSLIGSGITKSMEKAKKEVKIGTCDFKLFPTLQ
ncbi:hypothetical protein L195_g004188 [Trifolium pratense]|uniref:Uncharacterized protein n=1 Tax=Trifolium pratense TaxID=57577 RepID=A0A2K3NXC6_TRIPR|nr:hypothetical protein L195_g004188 [Trifolium pratense]